MNNRSKRPKLDLLFAIDEGNYNDVRAKLELDTTVINKNSNFPLSNVFDGIKHSLNHPQLLHVAIFGSRETEDINQRLNIIDLLINNGAEINGKDGDGNTPLHLACCVGNKSIVKKLLENKAQVNVENGKFTDSKCTIEKLKWTIEKLNPLHFAVIYGHEDIVDLLLESNVNIDQQDQYGNTLLMYAAMFGQESIFKKLLNLHADINIKNNSDCNVMHFSVSHIEKPEIIEMLSTLGMNINEANRLGDTVLHNAIENGHVQTAKKILKLGISINIQNKQGKTPLHLAAEKGDIEAVTILLNAGASVDMQDKQGKTPLHLAAEKGDIEAVTILLNAGASVDMQDKQKRTPLLLAAEKGNTEAVTILLDAGASVDLTDDFGRTPLNRAATKGYLATVRVLQGKSKNENLFHQKSEHSPMLFSNTNKENLVYSLLNDATTLMKTFHYAEANEKYKQALDEINKDPKYDSEDAFKQRMSRLIGKSQLLAKKTLNDSLEFGVSLSTPEKILSHIIGLEPTKYLEIYEYIEKLMQKPLLKPILEYVAMYFMINEKAHILMPNYESKENYKLGAEWGYQNSTVYLGGREKDKILSAFMHELSHFYFSKVYQNSSNPYPINDPEREKEFKETMKKVMINFYNKYYQSGTNEIKLKVDKMSSWEIGERLYHHHLDRCAASGKMLPLDKIQERLFSLYAGSYDEEKEAREFVVRLPELLSSDETVENLHNIFEPLFDYYNKYLIDDAIKFCNDISTLLDNFRNNAFSLKK